jgi:hypothetical protein
MKKPRRGDILIENDYDLTFSPVGAVYKKMLMHIDYMSIINMSLLWSLEYFMLMELLTYRCSAAKC